MITKKYKQQNKQKAGGWWLLSLLLLGSYPVVAQPNWGMPRVANTQTPLGENSQRTGNTPKEIAAPRPPMGWNSWNNFGLQITEAEFKKQVDYVAKHLRNAGYEYMVIDASWYSPSVSADRKSPYHHASYARHDAEIDSVGRFLPAKNKFPSAQGSFSTLAGYVHARGLKFGIHIQRGIPWQAVVQDLPIAGSNYRAKDIANPADVCLWFNATYGIDMSKPGAQEYYNSLFQLYAYWGVDFVKVDDLSMPYHADEITAIRKAIENCGRKIVFSASPGSTPLSARYHVMNNTDMFRVSSDFWDTWEQLQKQFEYARQWAVHSAAFPGRWPDLDMLPVGKIGTQSGDAGGERFTRFTQNEQYTLMTLWSISRSPLIISNDLTQNDAFTLQLLTNLEVLEVNQTGWGQKQLSSEKGVVTWTSNAKDSGSVYLAIFNQNERPQTVQLPLEKAGIAGRYMARDLWKRANAGTVSATTEVTVPGHGVVLYKLTPVQ